MSGNKRWTVAEDELIISNEFSIDALADLFKIRSRDAIIKRKRLLERYGLKGVRLLLSRVYPIGSIYMSVNNTNPSELFGGTWVKMWRGVWQRKE